jgi:hypothetical protein
MRDVQGVVTKIRGGSSRQIQEGSLSSPVAWRLFLLSRRVGLAHALTLFQPDTKFSLLSPALRSSTA